MSAAPLSADRPDLARWTRVADVPVHGVVERLVYVGSRLLAVTNEGAWPIDVTSPSLRRR